jgi:nitrate reductase NapAB chaperone NapD
MVVAVILADKDTAVAAGILAMPVAEVAEQEAAGKIIHVAIPAAAVE